ncbi:alpha-(1,3)-fucosyltransferase C-like [Daphnia pulex]|uniref:alpha-(1,3)-fucosyltransferase C-like n=1 Tax=Daphnia pulex TaxID=6669 RepID=UPI001EDFB57E|nr:alpha-(1,3)-fucosyltransferase C-like [Daphnia pulex]
MFQIGHRKIACLIVTGFLLKMGLQFYLDGTQQIAKEDQTTPKSANDVVNERYQIFESYFNDSLSDIDTPFKRILFWNGVYGSKDYGIGIGRDAMKKSGCPVWQCETSDNRSDVMEYDAVVFHLRTWTINDLPEGRSQNQRYVLWSLESAAWFADTIRMANFFNWTMTYRWDSDIVGPYGYIVPTGDVALHPSEDEMKFYLSKPTPVNYAKGKTKMAAWFVSNCNSASSRNEMVKILRLNDSSEDCRQMVAKKYKFYLSLENSLCRDYITEKFFGMMHHPIIPIVFSLHEDHELIAPTHSFINAAKFENMNKLADYLNLLDNNDTLYNQYFWWKPHFQVRDSPKYTNKGMCHLCAALHNTTMPMKFYPSIIDWWEKEMCIISPQIA